MGLEICLCEVKEEEEEDPHVKEKVCFTYAAYAQFLDEIVDVVDPSIAREWRAHNDLMSELPSPEIKHRTLKMFLTHSGCGGKFSHEECVSLWRYFRVFIPKFYRLNRPKLYTKYFLLLKKAVRTPNCEIRYM